MGAAIVTQPVVRDSVFWSGKALDSSGIPVTGAGVFLDFILLDQDEPGPAPLSKATAGGVFTELYTLMEVFDLFDESIIILDTLFPCDGSVCTVIQPIWDNTDPAGDKVTPGLYYYISTTYDAYSAERKSKIGPAWMAIPGIIGTTDAQGDFKIPPLPQDEKPISNSSGTTPVKYYKGWITLTFIKTAGSGQPDTLGRDTLCIFGPRRNLELHPH